MAFFKKTYETKNEVVIKLLPEKAKRDYILRLVSFIIIMVFIIINFFTLFLPRLNRISQINAINRQNYVLKTQYYNIQEIYLDFPINNYHITKNNDVQVASADVIDLERLLIDIRGTLVNYRYSVLERISYNNSDDQMVINVQLIRRDQAEEFLQELLLIPYVTKAEIRSHNRVNLGSQDQPMLREKVIYSLTIDLDALHALNEGGDGND